MNGYQDEREMGMVQEWLVSDVSLFCPELVGIFSECNNSDGLSETLFNQSEQILHNKKARDQAKRKMSIEDKKYLEKKEKKKKKKKEKKRKLR
mmetsp:Transcript_4888/g.4512  ORF Transcript_4888/g.4512 Transcript_4888/m.4512 type:complete len:93 (+) Transcript_4888:275-553(+)|eukprot:CAMPEP_0170561604 /NCGR_PEP_ID=MMETSP0211-20121228/55731_1 /TAXON_ID=311385 /ORGANISM="Pseudokeronopsis sp., Strain OXSARD2" /LENGTH=92 /DNA_ID=CAMNT_0010877365 /DNA_START=264 /DNA_END=542 /DNA_ORIENTATION=-